MAAQFNELIQKFYVGFYGRPADPDGLSFWAGQADADGWPSVRDAFANSAEANEFVFNDPATGQPYTNAELVTNIFNNLFGRDPDAAGLDFYVEALDDGTMTMATIVHNIIDGAQNEDLTVMNNKVEVAQYFTDNLGNKQYGNDQILAARSVLEGRLLDVNAAKADADAVINNFPGPVGDAIYLTLGQDVLTGTDGDDVFIANQQQNEWGLVQNTLATGDRLDGGAGEDTLIATLRNEQDFQGIAFNVAPELRNIENVEIRTIAAAVTFDAMSVAGVTRYSMFNSAGNLTLTNLIAKPEDMTFELRQVNPGVNFQALFNSDFQRDAENTMTLTIGTDAVTGDRLIGEGAEAAWYQKVQELQLEINGVLYTTSWAAGEEPETYQELRDDIAAWLTGEGINVAVVLRANPNVAEAAIAPWQIVLTLADGEFGAQGNWDVESNTPLVSNSITRATPGVVVEGLVQTNLELNTVGSTAQGSHVDLTAVAGSYRGVEEIQGQVSGFNNLESLTSIDNSPSGVYDHYLQEVYLAGDGVFKLGVSLSDLGFERLSTSNGGGVFGNEEGLVDVRVFDASGIELSGARNVQANLNVAAVLTNQSLGRYLNDPFQDWIDDAVIPTWTVDPDALAAAVEGTRADRANAWNNNTGQIRPEFTYTLAQNGPSLLALTVDAVLSTDAEFVLNINGVADNASNDRAILTNAAASFENVNVDLGWNNVTATEPLGNVLEIARSFNQANAQTVFNSLLNVDTLVLADQGQAGAAGVAVDANLNANQNAATYDVWNISNVVIATGANTTSGVVTGNVIGGILGNAANTVPQVDALGNLVNTTIDLRWTNVDTVFIDGINQVRDGSAVAAVEWDALQLFGVITLNNLNFNSAANVQLTNRDSTDGWLAVQQLTVNEHWNVVAGDGNLALNINSDTIGQRGITNNFNAINNFAFNVTTSTAAQQADPNYTELGIEHIRLSGSTDIWLPSLYAARGRADADFDWNAAITGADIMADFDGIVLAGLNTNQIAQGNAAGAFAGVPSANVSDTAATFLAELPLGTYDVGLNYDTFVVQTALGANLDLSVAATLLVNTPELLVLEAGTVGAPARVITNNIGGVAKQMDIRVEGESNLDLSTVTGANADVTNVWLGATSEITLAVGGAGGTQRVEIANANAYGSEITNFEVGGGGNADVLGLMNLIANVTNTGAAALQTVAGAAVGNSSFVQINNGGAAVNFGAAAGITGDFDDMDDVAAYLNDIAGGGESLTFENLGGVSSVFYVAISDGTDGAVYLARNIDNAATTAIAGDNLTKVVELAGLADAGALVAADLDLL